MKFLEANEQLKKLADGKYFTLKYELHTHSSNNTRAECTVYVDGYTHFSGPTWENALNQLKECIGNGFKADLTEAPEEVE